MIHFRDFPWIRRIRNIFFNQCSKSLCYLELVEIKIQISSLWTVPKALLSWKSVTKIEFQYKNKSSKSNCEKSFICSFWKSECSSLTNEYGQNFGHQVMSRDAWYTSRTRVRSYGFSAPMLLDPIRVTEFVAIIRSEIIFLKS